MFAPTTAQTANNTSKIFNRFAHSAGAFRESRGEKCQLSIWKNAVYLFSPRYFRNYSLLFFAARLSILQFTRIRGATFEITFYEFRNCNLLLFVALLSKLQFTHFRWATCDIAVDSFSRRQFRNWSLLAFAPQILPNRSNSLTNAPQPLPKNIQNAFQMAPKCCPKPSKIDKKLNRAATTSKMQKKKVFPNRCKALGPLFCDFRAHFGIQSYTIFLVFLD